MSERLSTVARLTVGLFVCCVVVAAVPTATTVSADRDTAAVEMPGTIQQDNGRLLVELSTASYNQSKPVSVTVAAGADGPTRTYTLTGSTSNGTSTYQVGPERLPGFDLGPATVTVEQNGTELARETLNLNHVVLTNDGSRVLQNGTVVLNTTVIAGFGDEQLTLEVRENGTGEVTTVNATRVGGSLHVSQSEVEQFYLPPTEFKILRGTGASSVQFADGTVTANLTTLQKETNVSTTADGLRVVSPALLSGTEYDVTVRTDEGLYETAVTADQSSAGGTLTLDNDQLLRLANVTVVVRYDGDRVLRTDHRLYPVVSLGIENTTESGTILDAADLFETVPANATLTTVHVVGANQTVSVSEPNVSNGSLMLPGIQLAGDGHYGLLFDFGNTGVYAAEIGDGSYGTLSVSEPSDSGDGSDGEDAGTLAVLVQKIPGGTPVLVVLVSITSGAIVLVVGISYVKFAGGSGSSGARIEESSVEIVVEDENGNPYEDRVSVSYVPKGDGLDGPGQFTGGDHQHNDTGLSNKEKAGEITGGRGTVELPVGRLAVSIDRETQRDERQINPIQKDEPVPFRLTKRQQTTTVRDEAGDPVEGVEVRIKSSRGSRHETTDRNGRAEFSISQTARDLELSTHHDVYEDVQRRARNPREIPDDVAVAIERGNLRVTTTVDGAATAGVEVSVTPVEDDGARDSARATTDSTGAVEFEDLVVGEYEVSTAVEGEWFSSSRRRVSVGADRRESMDLSVSFDFDLSGDQRRRLDELSEASDDLLPSQQLDGAIHYYYGTVFESVAETVRAIPTAGSQFVGGDIDPGRLVEELLTVGEEVLDATGVALNSKKNVDLFSACASMSRVRQPWDEPQDPTERLFGQTSVETDVIYRDLFDRIDEVDGFVSDRRSDVTTISPVREPLDEIAEYFEADNPPSVSRERHLALDVTIDAMLDAIESVFDQPNLRDRLERTVY